MSVGLIRFVDRYIGSLKCAVLGLFVKKHAIDIQKTDKILVIQLWGMGETILTLPAIKALQENHHIEVLATKRNRAVHDHTGIPVKEIGLTPFSLLKFFFANWRKYNIVIDFEEYLNTSALLAFIAAKNRIGFDHGARASTYHQTVPYDDEKHCAETFFDLVKKYTKKTEVDIPRLSYSKHAQESIQKFLGKTTIGIVPGAAESAKSRMWPKYAELINKLPKEYTVLLIGSEGEKEIGEDILSEVKNKENIQNSMGKINVEELFALIDNVELLISNDTGPLHVASAQKTPVIGLFGPNTPTRFGPYNIKSKVFYEKDSCKFSPCINVHKGQVPDCLYAKNSKDYQKCMKKIDVGDVVKAVKGMLK